MLPPFLDALLFTKKAPAAANQCTLTLCIFAHVKSFIVMHCRQAQMEGPKYSRLEADISAMQRSSSTYCDQPEDTADFEAWLKVSCPLPHEHLMGRGSKNSVAYIGEGSRQAQKAAFAKTCRECAMSCAGV